MAHPPQSLTVRGCLTTAARLARSAQRSAHPAARAGLAALAVDWINLACRIDDAGRSGVG